MNLFEIFEDIPVDEDEYLLMPFDFFVYRGFIFSARPVFIGDCSDLEENEITIIFE